MSTMGTESKNTMERIEEASFGLGKARDVLEIALAMMSESEDNRERGLTLLSIGLDYIERAERELDAVTPAAE